MQDKIEKYNHYEIYVRICKKCEEPFETYAKNSKVCSKCYQGQIWKMKQIYPTIKIEVTDGKKDLNSQNTINIDGEEGK